MDNRFNVIRAGAPEEHSPKVADLYLDPLDDEVFIVFSRAIGPRPSRAAIRGGLPGAAPVVEKEGR